MKGKLKKGDRIVIPFTIFCGECEQCKRGNYSACETTNRKKHLAEKVFGHTLGGLFGYTHLTGGYPGGQAEYLRVPYADTTHIKAPDSLSDEQLLFLSDILNELTDNKGPEKCIDAVGTESQVSFAQPDTLLDRAKQMMMMENDRPHVLREMAYVCRPAAILSIPGVYLGLDDKIPLDHIMNKASRFAPGRRM